MRRTVWILLVVVVAPLLLADFIGVVISDGGYQLTVHVGADDPPAAIACYPTGTREQAEWVCGRSPTPASFEQPGEAAIAEPFTGQPLKVQIWTSERTSPIFCRVFERSQRRFLVVVAVWRDGRQTCKIVDIPDGRVSREMRVSVL